MSETPGGDATPQTPRAETTPVTATVPVTPVADAQVATPAQPSAATTPTPTAAPAPQVAPAPSSTPTPPTAPAPSATPTPQVAPAPTPRPKGTLAELIESGAHFGHQTQRWNPKMKPFIFGERNGIHIINLDLTLPRLHAGLEFLRNTVADGGRVLFVATKRQAREAVKEEAERAGQFYVNNRWLGGMMTNFRTVKHSIEHFREQLATLADEERVAEFSKKEISRLNRSVGKYRKSLDGLREMQKLPDALFVIDLNKEHIAIAEAQRLGIPVVAVVDTNCSPEGIAFPIPANDDAIRAVRLYCALAADACLRGAEIHNDRLSREAEAAPTGETVLPSGRRVVEIQQPAAPSSTRTRDRSRRGGGGGRRRQAGGSFSAGGRSDEATPAPPPSAVAKKTTPAAPAPAVTKKPATPPTTKPASDAVKKS